MALAEKERFEQFRDQFVDTRKRIYRAPVLGKKPMHFEPVSESRNWDVENVDDPVLHSSVPIRSSTQMKTWARTSVGNSTQMHTWARNSQESIFKPVNAYQSMRISAKDFYSDSKPS